MSRIVRLVNSIDLKLLQTHLCNCTTESIFNKNFGNFSLSDDFVIIEHFLKIVELLN